MTWFPFFRYAVFGIVAACAALAVGHWALRTRRLSHFSRAGRLVRRQSDRWIAPVEHRLVRFGGNPQHAEWWFAGVALFGGIITISLTQWLVATGVQIFGLVSNQGARGIYAVAVIVSYRILVLAILVRVIASWLRVDSYARWLRPFYVLTEWMLRPLRRWIPTIGMIDITPLVAWIGLALLQSILLGFA